MMVEDLDGCRPPKMVAKSRLLHLNLHSNVLLPKSEVEHIEHKSNKSNNWKNDLKIQEGHPNPSW